MELLISFAILSLIMLGLAALTDQTRKIWKQTSQRIDAFSEARAVFESIARNLSQATLNTYWDYDSTAAPSRYVRRSELRFVSGIDSSGASLLSGGTAPRPGHAVFFQAPLGVSGTSAFRGLESMLNTCGYYVEYGDDQAIRPAFLNAGNLVPARARFRLMQLCEPSESLTLYTYTSGSAGYRGSEWYTTPIAATANGSPAYLHAIADNIVALVFLPKDPSGTAVSGTQALASSYTYNTAPAAWPPANPQPKPENQLPPLIQVTMVAIDEASAQRLQAAGGDPVAKLGLDTLFKDPGLQADGTTANFAKDLETLENTLQQLHMNYRVFNMEVGIRGAKWSKY